MRSLSVGNTTVPLNSELAEKLARIGYIYECGDHHGHDFHLTPDYEPSEQDGCWVDEVLVDAISQGYEELSRDHRSVLTASAVLDVTYAGDDKRKAFIKRNVAINLANVLLHKNLISWVEEKDAGGNVTLTASLELMKPISDQ